MKAIIVILLIFVLILFCGCTQNTSQLTITPNQTPIQTTPVVGTTVVPRTTTTASPEHTTVLQTPTPTPTPILTVKTYQTLVVVADSVTLEITVVDYNRGFYANDLVAQTNRYSSEPRSNYEYLLVHPRVIYKEGLSPIQVSEVNFKACIVNTSRCLDMKDVNVPFPEFGDKYLNQGDKIDGWIAFVVPERIDMKLAYTDSKGNPRGFILIK